MPPTPKELEQFRTDNKPGAYERYVDRLMAKPEYGEHQARYWLDAVRYGDTHGLQLDNERGVYPYRDWVIQSFNEDLPFTLGKCSAKRRQSTDQILRASG